MIGEMRLGVIPTIGPFLLPRVLPALREKFPELTVYLREEQTTPLLARLEDGEVDAALIALPCETGDLVIQHQHGHRLRLRRSAGGGRGRPVFRRRREDEGDAGARPRPGAQERGPRPVHQHRHLNRLGCHPKRAPVDPPRIEQVAD